MKDKYPYFWIVPVLVGLVFIFSNIFWVIPFINSVKVDAERYQLAVAERIASQSNFFIEQKLRALGELTTIFIREDSKKVKFSDLVDNFLKTNPDFLSVKLTPKSSQEEGYFLGSVFITNDNKMAVALSLSLNFMKQDVEAIIDLSDFINLISQEKIGERGYVYILDEKENIIYHPFESLNINSEDVLTVVTKASSTGWIFVVEVPVEEALAKQTYAVSLAAVLMVIGLIFVVILLINFKKLLNIALREKALNDTKNEYISLLAHRLRTPLSSTKWNLYTLMNGDWGGLNEKQKKFLERSYDSNEQMIHLIRDLLNIAKIEQGLFGFKMDKTNITKLLEEVIKEFKLPAKQADVRLIFKKSSSRIPHLLLDAEKMRVAVGNLIDNAIRYNLPGGKVDIILKKEEDTIKISVSDTGIGIPKKNLENLFSKFFRGDNVIRMQKEGFGLGLYMVKNIVEGHGGKITIQSEENKGSTFSIILPEK